MTPPAPQVSSSRRLTLPGSPVRVGAAPGDAPLRGTHLARSTISSSTFCAQVGSSPASSSRATTSRTWGGGAWRWGVAVGRGAVGPAAESAPSARPHGRTGAADAWERPPAAHRPPSAVAQPWGLRSAPQAAGAASCGGSKRPLPTSRAREVAELSGAERRRVVQVEDAPEVAQRGLVGRRRGGGPKALQRDDEVEVALVVEPPLVGVHHLEEPVAEGGRERVLLLVEAAELVGREHAVVVGVELQELAIDTHRGRQREPVRLLGRARERRVARVRTQLVHLGREQQLEQRHLRRGAGVAAWARGTGVGCGLGERESAARRAAARTEPRRRGSSSSSSLRVQCAT